MSVKCGLLTDKSAKIGSLSVNLSEILAYCPKNKKYVPLWHVFLSLFSCVRAHVRSLPHLANRVSPHNPLVPSTLARARRAYPSQARLGYAGAERVRFHTLLKNYSHSKPYSCEGCPDCGLLNIRSSCRSTAKQAVQVQESGCLLRLQDI